MRVSWYNSPRDTESRRLYSLPWAPVSGVGGRKRTSSPLTESRRKQPQGIEFLSSTSRWTRRSGEGSQTGRPPTPALSATTTLRQRRNVWKPSVWSDPLHGVVPPDPTRPVPSVLRRDHDSRRTGWRTTGTDPLVVTNLLFHPGDGLEQTDSTRAGPRSPRGPVLLRLVTGRGSCSHTLSDFLGTMDDGRGRVGRRRIECKGKV